MTQNIDEYFKSLNLNCTPTGIKTLEEQRAINSRGVQMITISKPFSQKANVELHEDIKEVLKQKK
jgi:hypothetical protein